MPHLTDHLYFWINFKILVFFSQKVPKSEQFVQKEKSENVIPPKEYAISETCVVLSIQKKQILQKLTTKNLLSQPKEAQQKNLMKSSETGTFCCKTIRCSSETTEKRRPTKSISI